RLAHHAGVPQDSVDAAAHRLFPEPLRAADRGARLAVRTDGSPHYGAVRRVTALRWLVQPRANERSTSPVRGLGANEVDLRGTRSPCAATSRTTSADSGGQMTAVRSADLAAECSASSASWWTSTCWSSSLTCHSRPSSRS